MKSVISYALNSVRRSPRRSGIMLAFYTLAICVVLLMNAAYERLFSVIADDETQKLGQFWLEAKGEAFSPKEIATIDAALKSDFPDGNLVLEAPLGGLIGGLEGSALVSGRIFGPLHEPQSESSDLSIKVGNNLASTLKLQVGDSLSALIHEAGLSVRVSEIVKTGTALGDRFYIEMKTSQALGVFENLQFSKIYVRSGTSIPKEKFESMFAALSSKPGLEVYGLELGNTNAATIIGIYKSNQGIVIMVLGFALAIAGFIFISLSIQERFPEFSALRSIGSPYWHLPFILLVTMTTLVFIAFVVGSLLSLGLSSLFNGLGGIHTPPPPGSTEDLIIYFWPRPSHLLMTFWVLVPGAILPILFFIKELKHISVLKLQEGVHS